MANIPIRDMTQTGVPDAASLIVFDNGTMRKGLVADLADGVRPVASQSEAEAGANNTKTMTPLRVKQSIAAEVGVTIASKAQGDLADTSLQPREPVVVTANGAITARTGAVAVQKTAPSATSLTLPAVGSQGGIPLSVFDISTSVVEHAITLTPSGSEKIMGKNSITLYSTADQMAGLTLYPSTTISGWFIAP